MRCPSCHYENESTARFCLDCGQRIEITCPECSKGSAAAGAILRRLRNPNCPVSAFFRPSPTQAYS